jgi:hypothetical protein
MFLEEVPMTTILLIHIALSLVAALCGAVALVRRYVAEERAERALESTSALHARARIGPGTYASIGPWTYTTVQFPTRLDGAEMVFAAHVVAFWESFTGREVRGLHA